MLFQSQIEGLVAAKVRFVVIGGVAANLHGSVRATFDLDICYDPAPANRERLATVLNDLGAYLRGVEPGLPFVLDAKALETSHVLTLSTTLGDIDVMDSIAGVGEFPDVLANSVAVEAGGVRFRALDLPALLSAKRAAGRPKDLAQIPDIEALIATRERAARKRRS